jgi:hypothetical protein
VSHSESYRRRSFELVKFEVLSEVLLKIQSSGTKRCAVFRPHPMIQHQIPEDVVAELRN